MIRSASQEQIARSPLFPASSDKEDEVPAEIDGTSQVNGASRCDHAAASQDCEGSAPVSWFLQSAGVGAQRYLTAPSCPDFYPATHSCGSDSSSTPIWQQRWLCQHPSAIDAALFEMKTRKAYDSLGSSNKITF